VVVVNAGGRTMEWLRKRLQDPEILVRLNAFFLSYFGWIAFGVLYGLIGRWSVDVTGAFLKLPLTSESFVLGLTGFVRSVKPLYLLFVAVYYIGFTGSIALAVFYLLIYLADTETSDRLLAGYLISYAAAGLTYLVFHIYAPHVVYNLQGFSSENTLFTRQEFVFPSLHNAIVTVNLMALWRHRHRLGARILIGISVLIPFATVLLGHHWIYDVLAGICLGVLAYRLGEGLGMAIPSTLYRWETSYLRKVTLFNFFLALVVLLMGLDPARLKEVIDGLMA